MDAIRYLDADTILDYLHNSSETYLEGLIPQSYGFPTETDRSVYVRLLKVPVRDKASEVYMQAIPYKMFEGDSNRPIEEFGKGRIETLSESVVKLVRSGTLTLDAALDVLQVSDDIRATVKENAEKALNQ